MAYAHHTVRIVRIWPISRPTMRINAIHTIILACAYDTWWQPATPADAQNSIEVAGYGQ